MVTVSLGLTGERSLRFEVTDDGVGFDPAAVEHRSGTQNMEDRVAAVDGTLAVRSAPGRGTSVVGEIPVEPAP